MKHFTYAILLAIAMLAECEEEGCEQLSSCESCTEGLSTPNISCEWVTCGSENSSCVVRGEEISESCVATNTSGKCKVLDNSSAEPPHEDGPSTRESSPPVFHTGSFIGGGLLVILMEAIGYFVLKRLHGPERDYQTMEEGTQ
ncbi:CD164 sialomucin-like 2 protein [Spea bombifrons]|uniref:CD164 sialomucin-like 2 protein n=1 Tax=Spea bombifrons TaxID=233779 RepID=UPI002349B5DA|nr:CD164 sialomucin-like 2 protein [Spea bombifrons]